MNPFLIERRKWYSYPTTFKVYEIILNKRGGEGMIKKFPETVDFTILWFNYLRIKKHMYYQICFGILYSFAVYLLLLLF